MKDRNKSTLRCGGFTQSETGQGSTIETLKNRTMRTTVYERTPRWLEASAPNSAGNGIERSTGASARTSELPSLNQIEQLRFLRAIASAVEVSRRHQMFRWLEGEFQTVLPHRLMVCTLVDGQGNPLVIDRFSSAPIASEDLQHICAEGSGLIANLGDAWLENGARPLVLVPGSARHLPFDAELTRLGLRACAVHGVLDHNKAAGSQFYFFGVPAERPAHVAYLLELLIPYLHTALIRVSASDQEGNESEGSALLSEREVGILSLVQHGKNNVEIATELSISPLTVKNHVQRILRKLGANNRAQAVGKAISLRILNASNGRRR
ncbi:MAG: LuxR C-terminal-related transcriptional regulator [Burkholderiales bacterium]|nr:LuxR C-terminal-related transcriptional regulator [Burkholderiales bacterium]